MGIFQGRYFSEDEFRVCKIYSYEVILIMDIFLEFIELPGKFDAIIWKHIKRITFQKIPRYPLSWYKYSIWNNFSFPRTKNITQKIISVEHGLKTISARGGKI